MMTRQLFFLIYYFSIFLQPLAHSQPSASGLDRVVVQATQFRIDDKPFFIKGANLPWLDGQYGHDLAPNYLHPEWGYAYDRARMKKHFRQLKLMNVNVVRFFVFEELEGLQATDGNITGVDPILYQNLDDVIKIANENGIRLYLTILDGVYGHNDLELEIKIFTVPEIQNQFLEKVVRPFAARYAGNTTIFAFDVLNESDISVSDSVTWDQMRTFIRSVAHTIHTEDSARLVSCSTIWIGWLKDGGGKYQGLGLDFYDNHQYKNLPDLQNPSELKLTLPLLLGEYGMEDGDADQQAFSTKAFLEQTFGRGWAGAIIWSFDYEGSNSKHRLLNPDGSWRQAGYVIRDFKINLIHPKNTQFFVIVRTKTHRLSGRTTTHHIKFEQHSFYACPQNAKGKYACADLPSGSPFRM